MKFYNMKCSINTTIKDTMELINRNTKGTVFVLDESQRLCGVITDGDIRRALLDGYGLNDSVKQIVKSDFAYARKGEDPSEITSRFHYAIKILPVVDNEMNLVDFTEFCENTHLPLAIPQLNGNEYKYLMDAFLSTWISSTGKYVDSFESGFAKYCGVKHGIATSNGTTALHLALSALGITEGDEVIVPNLTFAATINAVLYTGATPVIVDIEENGWCINPDCVEEAVTERTKAVIPVHLYGQPCDMERLCHIANKYHLFLVEDCAEAHGAEYDKRKVGGFGIISCFSFYGNKIITTGEGGMCLTDDDALNEKMRILRDHGMKKSRRYYHEVVGYNYRMTNIQAAIGTAQVEHIDDILHWRESLEELYRNVFRENKKIQLQDYCLPGRKKITWLVSILVPKEKRAEIMERLKENDIDVRSFFIPLNEMDIYKKYALTDCPVSREISQRGINLPTTYEIDEEKIQRIYNTIMLTLS